MSEYLERTQRIVPLLRQDSVVLERARECFQAVYNARSELSSYSPVHIPPTLLGLGEGRTHIVIGLNRSINDGSHVIPLALRLGLRKPYKVGKFEKDLEYQLDAYHKAFEYGHDPSYFIAAITAPIRWMGKELRTRAMLMEDISDAKRNILLETIGEEYAEVVYPNGVKKTRFIDPGYSIDSEDGEKYLEDRLRIDL